MKQLPGRLVLLGHPVAHSRSPAFQNAALRTAEIPLVYEALDVHPAVLDRAIRELVSARAAGNVTLPHKEQVAQLCARRTPIAERVGAVNTFWTEAGVLVGDNTDVAGFDVLARSVIGAAPRDLRVALLGAGGAAAAVAAAVESWPGATIVLATRNESRARAFAARFPQLVTVADSPADALAHADVVVNATPLGLQPTDPLPTELAAIPLDAAVVDLCYAPGGTAWVRSALERGHRAADGTRMLIEQGAQAFVRWFGVEPDREAMWAAFESDA